MQNVGDEIIGDLFKMSSHFSSLGTFKTKVQQMTSSEHTAEFFISFQQFAA
jgi:hypothetical protein